MCRYLLFEFVYSFVIIMVVPRCPAAHRPSIEESDMANPILESLLAPYRSAIAGEDPDYENDPLYSALKGTGSGLDNARTRPAAAPRNLDAVQRKLYKGFMDAGRSDLAEMVGTPAFDTWVNQESGYRPGAVSAANNQGLQNGGLFQFWYGHDFSNPYEGQNRFSMPVRKQARMAATQFDLDPNDILSYAKQIRSGTYKGWG